MRTALTTAKGGRVELGQCLLRYRAEGGAPCEPNAFMLCVLAYCKVSKIDTTEVGGKVYLLDVELGVRSRPRSVPAHSVSARWARQSGQLNPHDRETLNRHQRHPRPRHACSQSPRSPRPGWHELTGRAQQSNCAGCGTEDRSGRDPQGDRPCSSGRSGSDVCVHARQPMRGTT